MGGVRLPTPDASKPTRQIRPSAGSASFGLCVPTSIYAWGCAPGWDGSGRWPLGGSGAFLGRCPRLEWGGPLALGRIGSRSRGGAPGWDGGGPLALGGGWFAFLGRCPRLGWGGPLALGGVGPRSWGGAPGWYGSGRWPWVGIGSRSWGVAPGWDGSGRWPLGGSGAFLGRCPRLGWGGPLALMGWSNDRPGALPQAGMGRAVGPYGLV